MGKGKGSGSCNVSSMVIQEIEEAELPKNWNSEELNISYVSDQESMAECLKALRHPEVKRLGLDIETTGGLKPWHGTTRLIQIGVELPEPRQFLIDCWAIDPAPILPLLEDPQLEVVTCNGKYEQTHLHYRYGVVLTNLYDVCYASRSISAQKNEPAREAQRQASREAEAPYKAEIRSLASRRDKAESEEERDELNQEIARVERNMKRARTKARKEAPKPRKIGNDFRRLMRRYVGKKISKTQQTSEWDAPELSENQRRYAAMDVAGLLDIRRAIGRDVEERGLEAEVEAANRDVLDKSLTELSNADLAAQAYTRMARAMTHCETRDQLDSLYASRGQMTLHHSFRRRMEELYRERLQELS